MKRSPAARAAQRFASTPSCGSSRSGPQPSKAEIWGPLLEIYRKLEATDLLTALIGETLPLIDSPSQRNRLRIELATGLLAKPETEGQAIELLQHVLEDDPTDVESAILL